MPSDTALPYCEKEVEILYQDGDIMFVNKPEYLLSVPGRLPANFDSVFYRIQQLVPETRMAHRLDLDTSGIMIIAMHLDALRDLSRQFQERTVKKSYTAVVHGIITEDEGSVDLPLRCDWPNRPRQMVCYEHGKNALTHYKVIERNEENNTTRVELLPITGRSHQLRVHMLELGHPILGCDLYAHEEALAMSPRLLLHATTLEIKHPVTGQQILGYCQPEF